jgi:hypothetical protein
MTTLTLQDAGALAEVLRLVETNSPVRWLVPGTDTIASGVARAITQDGGGFYREGDVRDAFLWISGTMEFWVPVSQVMDMIRSYNFAAYRP